MKLYKLFFLVPALLLPLSLSGCENAGQDAGVGEDEAGVVEEDTGVVEEDTGVVEEDAAVEGDAVEEDAEVTELEQ